MKCPCTEPAGNPARNRKVTGRVQSDAPLRTAVAGLRLPRVRIMTKTQKPCGRPSCTTCYRPRAPEPHSLNPNPETPVPIVSAVAGGAKRFFRLDRLSFASY